MDGSRSQCKPRVDILTHMPEFVWMTARLFLQVLQSRRGQASLPKLEQLWGSTDPQAITKTAQQKRILRASAPTIADVEFWARQLQPPQLANGVGKSGKDRLSKALQRAALLDAASLPFPVLVRKFHQLVVLMCSYGWISRKVSQKVCHNQFFNASPKPRALLEWLIAYSQVPLWRRSSRGRCVGRSQISPHHSPVWSYMAKSQAVRGWREAGPWRWTKPNPAPTAEPRRV